MLFSPATFVARKQRTEKKKIAEKLVEEELPCYVLFVLGFWFALFVLYCLQFTPLT